jgi:DNA-binding SARP family transcriptional activator
MAIVVDLLGVPSVSIDGSEIRPRGRKVWALFAYLVLADHSVPRAHLTDLLFGEADDPGRALRWNLTELRHLLGPNVVGAGDPVTLTLGPGASVDVSLLAAQHLLPTPMPERLGRDLLEGMTFGGCPAFEAWLVNQRRYLRSRAADLLRDAAIASLSAGETDVAIDHAVRLVALDPLEESSQALLVRCYAVAGDAEAATRQLEACRRLLQSELGIEPSEAVVSAVHSSPATIVRSPVGGRRAIQAQIEAGRAATRAGALDAGSECFRRAAAESHSLGDLDLGLESLLALGSALAHAGIDRHQEAAAALHGAIASARRLDNGAAAADAHMELAWMDFLRARYVLARTQIEAALEEAPDDDAIRCLGLWMRGKCAVETGDYAGSLADLTAAVELVDRLDDPMRR